jgi:hypothetical protein
MLEWQSMTPELVLHVNERPPFRRPVMSFGRHAAVPLGRHAAVPLGRRALRRRLSVVAARLERTVGYQTSLQRVLAAGDQFQRTLDEAQRTSWLTLEDALHDHAWRESRAFFRAGVELGWRLAGTRSFDARPNRHRPPKHSRPTPHTQPIRDDTSVILSLLATIRRLLER